MRLAVPRCSAPGSLPRRRRHLLVRCGPRPGCSKHRRGPFVEWEGTSIRDHKSRNPMRPTIRVVSAGSSAPRALAGHETDRASLGPRNRPGHRPDTARRWDVSDPSPVVSASFLSRGKDHVRDRIGQLSSRSAALTRRPNHCRQPTGKYASAVCRALRESEGRARHGVGTTRPAHLGCRRSRLVEEPGGQVGSGEPTRVTQVIARDAGEE